MANNQPPYNPAVVAKLLARLGVTNDQFDDEDLFLIEPAPPGRDSASSPYAVRRLPSLSAERYAVYVALMQQDRPLDASKEEVEAAFIAIPFYNPKLAGLTGRDGIRIIANDDVRVQVDNKTYELPAYANIMWQPNLAGKLLSKFVTANAQYSLFHGSGAPTQALQDATGYWIDLRNFRSTMREIEGYPLQAGQTGGHSGIDPVINPLHNGTIDPTLMPDYLGMSALFVSPDADQTLGDSLYAVAWDDAKSPKPGEYTIYHLTRSYWTTMQQLSLDPNDISQQRLITYVVQTQSQVAALSDWQANAIGIANHGLCCVVNLTSFTR